METATGWSGGKEDHTMAAYHYGIGDKVTYTNFLGNSVTVTVTDRCDDIKNGRPGFNGYDSEGATWWGYDSQITRVFTAPLVSFG